MKKPKGTRYSLSLNIKFEFKVKLKSPSKKHQQEKKQMLEKKKVMVVVKKPKNKIKIIIITENLVGMIWVNFILQGGTFEWKAWILKLIQKLWGGGIERLSLSQLQL